MQDSDKTRYLNFAIKVVEAAGPIALKYFRRDTRVADKGAGGAFDPVTAADREIEASMRQRITECYPDHTIIGEELGGAAIGENGDRPCWVIDPIDGTRAFISGMPAWGIMLGMAEAGEPEIGVVHQPLLGETFAGDGNKCILRGASGETSIRTRSQCEPQQAILYCTHPSMFSAADLAAFERVSKQCLMSRFGGDCYSYCLLALGRIDLVIEADLQPYDILPLVPIIEGAGGIVTDWSGQTPSKGGRVVAAGDCKLHAWALSELDAT